MPVSQISYLRHGFPALAYTYAQYCDWDFSTTEHGFWLVEGPQYRGYLDFYRCDPSRAFPPDAEQIVAVDVPSNPRSPTNRLLPTRAQAWAYMEYLIAELTNQPCRPTEPPPPPTPDRSLAKPSGERPLLSCLSCIFLNQDPRFGKDEQKLGEFLAEFGLRDESIATLRTFANSDNAYLTFGQALSLSNALVDELVRQPSVW